MWVRLAARRMHAPVDAMSTTKNIWLVAVALVLGACGDDVAPSDAGPDSGLLNHDEVLEQLLASALDRSPRVDPNGDPVRDDYNPFGRRRRYLHRLSEVHLAGLSTVAGRRQMLIDDASGAYATMYTELSDDAWATLPKASASGDIDGDGRDEVVMAVINNAAASADFGRFYLRIIDDAGESYAVDEVTLDVYPEVPIALGFDWLKIDVAVGDIDGDGRHEIAATAFSDLWVVDDQRSEYSILRTASYPVSPGAVQYLRVASGDTNADALDEIVVVDGQIVGGNGTATYRVLDQAFVTKSEGRVEVSIASIPYLLATADASIADVDGDGLDEVVFAGRRSGYGEAQVLVLDDAQAGYQMLPIRYGFAWANPIVRVETGDFDGDGRAEIVAYREVIDDVTEVRDGILPRQSYLPHDVLWSNAITVGDVSDDWRDDIVYLTGTDTWLVAWGTDSTGVYRQLTAMNTSDEYWNFPTVTTVNTDGDSAIVEFEDHEILFTEPVVLAVLVAPPSYTDIPMDLGDASTRFGRGSSSGVEEEQSIGFSTGWTVGTEFEDRLFSQSKARFSLTVETAMDWTAMSSREIETAYYWNGTAESDKVVFLTVPFDVYYYRVLSSPIAAEVGTTMVVNLPRDPVVRFVDREFFNGRNGSFADVDDRIVAHTIGVPGSYPTRASLQLQALPSRGGAYSDTRTVGQGPGSQTCEITITDGLGYGTNFDLNVTLEAEVGAGGFFAGRSVGFHYGYGYRITSTTSTIYEGTVGNIVGAEDWNEHQFDFGLYVEPKSIGGHRFPMIGYWVD